MNYRQDKYKHEKQMTIIEKENKQKHLNTFKAFLRRVSTNKVNCPEGNDNDLLSWIDYTNKTLGVFKVIKYDQ